MVDEELPKSNRKREEIAIMKSGIIDTALIDLANTKEQL
jgi:hypothetical protein